MQVQKYQFNSHIGDHEIVVETGTLALLAGGAVTLRSGESVLLATATGSRKQREGIDFFPLSVDFEEKLYAAGRIPGSFFRREGRPSEGAILTARLTDRPLRPLFPKGMRNEVQIIVTALASDGQNLLDVLAINAASCALIISDVPWDGPVGAVRVGYIDGDFVANPTAAEMESSTLDLRIAGTADAILMVEAGADEVPEDVMLEALKFAHASIQDFVAMQQRMREEVGKPKFELHRPRAQGQGRGRRPIADRRAHRRHPAGRLSERRARRSAGRTEQRDPRRSWTRASTMLSSRAPSTPCSSTACASRFSARACAPMAARPPRSAPSPAWSASCRACMAPASSPAARPRC